MAPLKRGLATSLIARSRHMRSDPTTRPIIGKNARDRERSSSFISSLGGMLNIVRNLSAVKKAFIVPLVLPFRLDALYDLVHYVQVLWACDPHERLPLFNNIAWFEVEPEDSPLWTFVF